MARRVPADVDAGMGGGGGFGGGPGGGGGRGGRGGQNPRDAANRISIGVNTRTNNLVMAATDPLFEEVKQLVQRTRRGGGLRKTKRCGWSPCIAPVRTAVEKALAAFAGDAVQSTSPTTSAPAPIILLRRGPPEALAAWAAAGLADSRGWVALAGNSAAMPRPTKVVATAAVWWLGGGRGGGAGGAGGGRGGAGGGRGGGGGGRGGFGGGGGHTAVCAWDIRRRNSA